MVRTTTVVILRLFVDPATPELRGAMQCIPEGTVHPFSNDRELLAWLHRVVDRATAEALPSDGQRGEDEATINS